MVLFSTFLLLNIDSFLLFFYRISIHLYLFFIEYQSVLIPVINDFFTIYLQP